MHVATLKWQEEKKKCNPQFPIRFKEDFGGEEDIRPAAKEDVEEFTGTSRIPRGRILLVLGGNFKLVSATSNPNPIQRRDRGGFSEPGLSETSSDPKAVGFRSAGFATTLVNIPSLARRAGALTTDVNLHRLGFRNGSADGETRLAAPAGGWMGMVRIRS